MKQRTLLSKLYYFLGDVSYRIHFYSLYNKLMRKSVQCDPKGLVWKIVKKEDEVSELLKD